MTRVRSDKSKVSRNINFASKKATHNEWLFSALFLHERKAVCALVNSRVTLVSADLDFVECTIVFTCAMIFATCYTTFDTMVSFAITCHNKNRPNFIFGITLLYS